MEASKSVEVEGGTIDEAIENALRALGAERDRVEIEILTDAARGILGIGRKRARVRAWLRPPVTAGLGTGRGSHERSTGAPEKASPKVTGSPPGSQERRAVEPAGDEVAARAKEVLAELLRRMGFVVEVKANGQRDDGAVELAICGEDSGLLIGRHGQTLDALEYLIGRVACKGEDAKQRVVLECGSYRQSRQKALEQMALKLGERVKQRGRPVTMEAMSPRDRRIVHMALRVCEGLITRSVGDGYYRKLRILPATERRGERS